MMEQSVTILSPGTIIATIGDRDLERSTRVRGVRRVPYVDRAPFDAEPGWYFWQSELGKGPAEDHAVYRTRSRRLAAEAGPGVYVSREDDPLAWDAPLPLTRREAEFGFSMGVSSPETRCSVREEHGRWVYETGTGGRLIVHGSADTRAEAEAMATALVWSAWLRRVENILKARGGSLRWGLPISTPQSVALRVLGAENEAVDE